VDQDAQYHYGHPTDKFHDRPEDNRADGIDHAEADHDVAHVVYAQGTGYERLKRKERNTAFVLVRQADRTQKLVSVREHTAERDTSQSRGKNVPENSHNQLHGAQYLRS
jgi:hypothetical protein